MTHANAPFTPESKARLARNTPSLAHLTREQSAKPRRGRWLAERGYDPIYGTRPLRRLMQQQIDDQLATALLDGSVRDGDLVRVELNDTGDGGAGCSERLKI